MKFTFRDMAWIAVVVLIVLYLSKCHRNKTDDLNTDVKQLQDKVINDSIRHAQDIINYEQQIKAADSVADVIEGQNKTMAIQLDQKAATVLRLSGIIKEYELPTGTDFITVGPEYIQYCDSLADESTSMAISYDKYKRNTAYLIAAKDTAISARDGLIATERKALQDCKNDFNALMHFYKQSTIKPRTQVYVGVELIGTPAALVNNVGAAITIKTKSNKLWQLSGGLQTNGQYYARVNGNILIKLKN